MSWAWLLTGSQTPSRARWIVNFCFLALCASAGYGFWNDFVPSSAWVDAGMYISAAAGVLATVAAFWGYKRWYANVRASKGSILLAVLLTSSLLTWLALVHGVGGLATTVIGERHVITVLLGERAFPDYLCVSEARFDAIPAQGTVRLEGKQSAFGFAISKVAIAK